MFNCIKSENNSFNKNYAIYLLKIYTVYVI